MRGARPGTIFLKDYRPPRYLIDQAELRFELGGDNTRVQSRLAMRLNPASGSTFWPFRTKTRFRSR